jgi:hypothetical protein
MRYLFFLLVLLVCCLFSAFALQITLALYLFASCLLAPFLFGVFSGGFFSLDRDFCNTDLND